MSMKMLAVREYKKITGFNLLSPTHKLTDIWGDGAGKEFSPELAIALVFCMLKNGDMSFSHSLDEVGAAMRLTDVDLARMVTKVYIEEMTGQSVDENAVLSKNLQAPETTTPGA